MQKATLLDNVSIVLVDTRTPANIGAAARCMMNMGLSRLILVDPLKTRIGMPAAGLEAKCVLNNS
jgi:tRNA C32,U32 (ribose-2'-O)-methylase TrmJ